MKRFVSLISAVLLCVALCVPAFAVNNGFVFDISDVSITEEHIKELNEAAKKISKDYGVELLYFVTDDLGECASTSVYAQKAYERNISEGETGACFAYYIKENKMFFYCAPEVKSVITEEVQTKVYDDFNNSKTYYEAAAEYYKYLGEVLKQSGGLPAEEVTEKATQEIPDERLLPHMVDNAGLLTAEQRTALNRKLKEYSEQCQCDISIVTVNSTEGKDVELYTVDFYDFNGFGYGSGRDGLMLLLSMEGRDWCVSRHGKSEYIFSQSVTDEMVGNISEYLSDNDYYTAFDKFADDYLYKYEHAGKVSPVWIPIDIVIGFLIAYVVMKAKTSNLTSVRAKKNAAEYVVPGSMAITASSDRFLYMNVVKTPRPKETSSSSGGGHITGSSGSSHSVSSGKF